MRKLCFSQLATIISLTLKRKNPYVSNQTVAESDLEQFGSRQGGYNLLDAAVS